MKALISLLCLALTACTSGSTKLTDTGHPDAPPSEDPGPAPDLATSCAEDTGVIVATPDAHAAYRDWGFDRYAELMAPNGKPIRLFAETGVTNEQVHRARNVLRWFLSDVAGSTYGTDKSAVANAMANNGATLMLPAGAHRPGHEPPFDAQPLFQDEMTVEGGDWYLNHNLEHRDATFEEIFHLVHDAGIGTWLPGALPDYQTALKAEAIAAIADGRWGIPVDSDVSDWIAELEAEDSLAQEYIASVIDSYYGYWGPFEGSGGMWGVYIAGDRAEVAALDPAGLTLLEAFLPKYASYEARLASDFEGTFQMAFDEALPYTHKSQYLTQVTLTGSKPASIIGNASNNVLRGNSADNTLDGGGGDDTAIYCGARADYTLSQEGSTVEVEGPDGRDVLLSIETLYFTDQTLSVADI